ncbi:MAG: sugar nucleotide-binding protein [Microgenomates group bacterium]|nr:sugar nucleotide-binding protein [Microgenomates group bacterium]
MLKIALTGADGLVGSRIVELLNKDFKFICLNQKIIDITNQEQVFQVLKPLGFDIFLHLAAYTNVSQAEREKNLCFKINVEGTKNIFEVVSFKKKKFVYISTDFVFDGKNPPYFEDSPAKPIGIYGRSKYEGEKIVANSGMIIRISYPYRAKYKKKLDFLRRFKSLFEEKKPLTMITNATMTPTFIDDIAYGLKYLMNNYSAETFHLVGSNSLSPYQAACQIATEFNLDQSLIKKITYEEYVKLNPTIPQWSTIKSKKNNFYKMKNFIEGLSIVKKQIID